MDPLFYSKYVEKDLFILPDNKGAETELAPNIRRSANCGCLIKYSLHEEIDEI